LIIYVSKGRNLNRVSKEISVYVVYDNYLSVLLLCSPIFELILAGGSFPFIFIIPYLIVALAGILNLGVSGFLRCRILARSSSGFSRRGLGLGGVLLSVGGQYFGIRQGTSKGHTLLLGIVPHIFYPLVRHIIYIGKKIYYRYY